ncbi:MAG: citrate lyase subunit alpha [Clostridia bacterium]|nr:citrate lyase subunit alpha [Clostridia bacterium]
MSKLVSSLREALEKAGLQNGMTISFHHHLRNGDYVLNMVLEEAEKMGVRDLGVEASSVFDVHAPIIDHIRNGVVTRLGTNYMGAKVGKAITQGVLDTPVIFRTHGGRPNAIETGKVKIDIAFVAAPCADEAGNANGIYGKSACGSMGYAVSDAKCADKTVVITDCLMPYPLSPASIEETNVDFVVKVDEIGDAKGIVSGTTQITRDPVGLKIAQTAADVIKYSGYLENGFSFQTGAGGASLAVTKYLKPIMREKGVKGSFGLGGITSYMVDMLKEGYFEKLMDVQCFDLGAVASLRENPNHIEVSASRYASPGVKSACVDHLDTVILGATQVDLDFNVNVHTDSNGFIMGGSGGHSDTAAGAKLAIIVAPLYRARLPIVVERVHTKSTPGSTVDVLVTQRGVAVNPKREELRQRLIKGGLPVFDIGELKNMAERVTGTPEDTPKSGRVVAKVEYRDGTIIDEIRSVE